TGRYLRVLGITRGTPYGYSLYEVEVYGAAPSAAKSGSAQAATAKTSRLQPVRSAYPNPTTGRVHLQQEHVQSVDVVNTQGQVLRVLTGDVSDVDLSGLPAGFYSLKVRAADGVHTV
uniref:T9SS type A sorting domain-containing protein n=1 Tax=Hymenobacter terrenus TaxID=1629124 RepID=UPI000619C446